MIRKKIHTRFGSVKIISDNFLSWTRCYVARLSLLLSSNILVTLTNSLTFSINNNICFNAYVFKKHVTIYNVQTGVKCGKQNFVGLNIAVIPLHTGETKTDKTKFHPTAYDKLVKIFTSLFFIYRNFNTYTTNVSKSKKIFFIIM